MHFFFWYCVNRFKKTKTICEYVRIRRKNLLSQGQQPTYIEEVKEFSKEKRMLKKKISNIIFIFLQCPHRGINREGAKSNKLWEEQANFFFEI